MSKRHNLVEDMVREMDANRDAPAWLWAPVDAQPSEPPLVTRPTLLPISDLSWENTERLFLRLLAQQGDVQWAKLYGTRGQDQQGIDAYARLTRSAGAGLLSDSQWPSQRRHAVLQSRRVRKLSPSDITRAIDDFLEGAWEKETSTFYYATSYDLADAKLDVALRQAADRLEKVGITFVPWGADEISAMLRSKPDLVDDFFGRAWVGHFCGAQALSMLEKRLQFHDFCKLRQELAFLYEAVFDSQNAIRRPTEVSTSVPPVEDMNVEDRFVMVDVAPRQFAPMGETSWLGNSGLAFEPVDRMPAGSTHTQIRLNDFGGRGEQQIIDGAAALGGGFADTVNASPTGRPRRTLRPVRTLLELDIARTREGALHQAADDWLSDGSRNLLIGEAGSGKSSLMRFVAADLLSRAPQSRVLQRVHGGRLPVWLPFGFLCRHLDEAQSNSLPTAIHTWLDSRAAGHLWPLVERALGDDRLLLLVDGIDEWTSREAANIALDSIETFLGRTKAAAFLSSRPYAVARLASALSWRQADLMPLDDEQRRQMVVQYLPRGEGSPTDERYVDGSSDLERNVVSEAVPGAIWRRSNVEPFLGELRAVTELSSLARTPLFLALLATTWRGEPLPPKRYELYGSIVDLMVERHPQMRRRSSRAGDLPLSERDFKATIEAVAYSLRLDGHVGPIPMSQVRRLLQEALCDEDVVGLLPVEARRMAELVLNMAEDEFGLLVPQGANHVGFIHRVVLDQLAGQRLARLEISTQIDVFRSRHADPAWTDLLLSALTAQPNPPTVARILDAVLQSGEQSGNGWPWNVRQEQSALELLAAAVAAEANLSPRKTNQYLDLIVERIEAPTSLEHRAALLTSLVKSASHASLGRRLLPTFKRWLDATRTFPGPALYALRDLPIDAERASAIMLRGMRFDSGDVRANAAVAYANRFGSPRRTIESAATDSSGDAISMDSQLALDRLADLVKLGPTVTAQATALFAMGLGWPDSGEAREHLAWGRRQDRVAIRTTALYFTMEAEPEAPLSSLVSEEEIDWLLSQPHEEHYFTEHAWTKMTFDLVVKAAAEANEVRRAALSSFVWETLRTNGRTGGDRSLCWRLACTSLSADNRLRDWVIDELEREREHPLPLYDLTLIPQSWRNHFRMEKALDSYAERRAGDFDGSRVRLARSLPREHARKRLLGALDGFRPWGAAACLVHDFWDDAHVRSVLRARLMDDAIAAKYAPVALDVLGFEAGFERLFALLVDSNEEESQIRDEEQVILAQSVAIAWRRLRELANADEGSDAFEVSTASDQDGAVQNRERGRRILGRYEDAEVCNACTNVSTAGLGWHVGDIITTWPALTADYALEALSDDRHVLEGVDDSIHPAVLRAYGESSGANSERVLDAALDLMRFLEPELREVLAHELCSAGLDPSALLDVLSAWKRDDDNGVRRTVVVGVTQALIRAHRAAAASGVTTEMLELAHWRDSVREQLCSYGPSMEENRQNAWIAMLLLGELDLVEGLRETIGDATEPGVRLTDINGTPDQFLVEIIVAHWDALSGHFGDGILRRLSKGRRSNRQDEVLDKIETVGALALAADSHPDVARLVHNFLDRSIFIEAEDDGAAPDVDPETKGAFQRFQDNLRVRPAVVDLQLSDGESLLETFEKVLAASDKAPGREPQRSDQVTQWVLSHLLGDDSRNLHSDELRELIAGALEEDEWLSDRAYLQTRGSLRRSVWALLFPDDRQTQAWVSGLAQWFSRGPKREGQPSNWLEVSALCIGATPAEDLPAIIGRIFHPGRMEYVDRSSWELTIPTLYRLRQDEAAVLALSRSLSGGAIPETSPFFRPLWSIGREEVDQRAALTLQKIITPRTESARKDHIARRIFVTALALKHSGHLSPNDLETAARTLVGTDQRTVVVDPFTNQAGPLFSRGVALLQQ
ncbi:NACHT domain-containing protein [Arthrobacter sp. ISL-48]|uniref:NACHT domain-containing protein n=1 Tax=Arthrobacter sp. ISL-48 TaxID=2819110 RepID=UPI001BECFB50|nr:NACHT domain-containing protein [Arthrobacter sp. ISL-48]MBT2532908.1 NACHT domain-containing protein [Arthrobacter sp. ISL-48]